MKNKYAVILAAGQGTRMKSKLYKVLHPVCGKPMVKHVVDVVKVLPFSETIVIVGHGAEKVRSTLGEEVTYALQEEQLGTGHAVLQAAPILEKEEGTTVVLCGDTPLITKETLEKLLLHHEKEDASVTVLTANIDDPTGYGRIVRGENGLVERIVEHKDATEEERRITEINTGIYCFDNRKLFVSLQKVTNNNAQGEYYLPDVIEILKNEGEKIAAYRTDDFTETLGVNDRIALAEAERVMRKRILGHWMKEGVTIVDPDNTYISCEAIIGQDTTILPGTIIAGKTEIGSDCIIGPNTQITNSQVGNRTVIKHSVVTDSVIQDDVSIGPFAHIRPESRIGNDVRIGNFVEVKKSTIDNRSKVSHLSYIGDAEVGKDVNVGCGSITVNYDGRNKHLTRIEDGAFIGCNANLIAPVTVGEGAFIAAGSTITDDVPSLALAIARSRQTNKENYMKFMKK